MHRITGKDSAVERKHYPAPLREGEGGGVRVVASTTESTTNSTNSNNNMHLSWSAGPLVASSTFAVAIRRFGLLASLLALQSGSQVMLQRYEELIKEHVVILLFMTMVVGAGGNAGNQAALSVITAILASRNYVDMTHSPSSSFHEALRIHSNAERDCCSSVVKPSPAICRMSPHQLRVRLAGRVSRMMHLWRRLLRRRWMCPISSRYKGIGTGGGGRISWLTVSFIYDVLRYEILLGLCCGVILMVIGALRVGLFLWLDNGEEVALGKLAHSTPSVRIDSGDNLVLLVALSLALFLTVFLSVVIGAMLPFMVGCCGVSIEHAAPIVQVVMDLLGTWLCCVTCNTLLPNTEKPKLRVEGRRGQNP